MNRLEKAVEWFLRKAFDIPEPKKEVRSGIDPQVTVFYDRALLARALPHLVFDRFAQPHSSKTIKFRRYESLSGKYTEKTREGDIQGITDLTNLNLDGKVVTGKRYPPLPISTTPAQEGEIDEYAKGIAEWQEKCRKTEAT